MANYIPRNSLNEPIADGSESEKVREKLEPVVSAPAKDKKKSRWQRVKDEFVSEDRGNIVDYLLFDVFIPAVKDTIVTMGVNSIDMLFNGRNSKNTRYNYSGQVSYRPYYDQREPYYNRPRVSGGYDFNLVTYPTKDEAYAVLCGMQEFLDKYQIVDVAAYLELSRRGSSFTDTKYGWTSLNGVRVVQDIRSKEFYLDLPRPMALD